MYYSLSSLVPNAADLLALEVEELSGVLLTHLNSRAGSSGDTVCQHGLINLHNFLLLLQPSSSLQKPEYGDRQAEVSKALLEAWAWLQREAFLVRNPEAGSDWFFLSRRAQRLKSRDDFAAYQKANLLPKAQLHPAIAGEVYPAFLRGKYDTAVFEAFREVEIAVRDAGHFKADDVGVPLMRAAFKVAPKPGDVPGPLTDAALPIAEQEAMAHVFAGAIGLYKNPQSHRHVPTRPEEAAEVILFASQLLRLVDQLATKSSVAKS